VEWIVLRGTFVQLGDEIGSYKIVGHVGQGGMAAVYVGEHLVVRHRVAIKVIHPRHLDNARMAQRFLNEARAVAAIRHPGIVEFYDFGVDDDGQAYIVMELLTGHTLATRLIDGPIPVRRAMAFGRQMASALGAAHERGIVHRDLTPSNVFLVPDPDVLYGERAKILDFGIAKQVTRENREEVTGSGVVIGTPAHMSPEQCRGDRDVDGRSDVYALGVLMYRMVTGRLPFDSANTDEIVTHQLFHQCPPASTVDPRIPVDLSDVIQRCMAKDRAKRYASMADLVLALTDVADALDVGAAALLATGEAPAPALAIRRPPPVPPPRVVSLTPTSPWVPAAAPSREREQTTAVTLTRPIVERPGFLAKVRARARPILATATTFAVVAALVTALNQRGSSSPPPAAIPAVMPPPIALPTPAADEEPPPRERRKVKEEREEEQKQEQREEKKEKKEKRDDKKRDDKKRKTTKAKAPPAPAPAPEDPFAKVATPAVY
jgi:serine/threonine-protein kinase